MVNTKYVVILMIGIFLALGLGMLIGITIENQNIIENQQTQLVNQIEDHFDTLKEETSILKNELEITKKQNDELLSISNMLLLETVKDKLQGLNIGIITFSNKETPDDLLNFLSNTGALLESNIQFDISSIPDVFGYETNASTINNQYQLISVVIGDLLDSLAFGGKTPLIKELEELNIISNKLEYKRPIDKIILIGQGQKTVEYDMLFVSSAIDNSIPVVAVEAGAVDESAIGEYKSIGISTVDHIDTIYGKLALTSILQGNTGNFGLGNEASSILPDPLFIEVEEPLEPLDPIEPTEDTSGDNIEGIGE